MKIGLLQCDHVADSFLHLNGDYDRQFADLLPGFDWTVYDLTAGQFPSTLDDCDAYLCTGSKYSVYDDIPWIHELKKLVQDIYRQQQPFIGVCFGHQMMAEALGGKVGKAEIGWCVGVHRFRMVAQEDWMEPFQEEVNLLMSCQDQVLALPPDSVVLAETADCPVGMFRVGKTMLGMQAHPEFSKDYALGLMEVRLDRIGVEKVKRGLESLNLNLQDQLLRRWMARFLNVK